MSRSQKIGIGAVLAVVVAIAAVWFVFFNDDEPGAVSLDAAVEQVEDDATADPVESIDDLAGPWTIDAESGTFDYESATGTFVGFRVDEELTFGASTAVGRTGAVEGSLTFDGTVLSAVRVDADLSEITTNESRRDRRTRSALNTDEHPIASFVLAEPIDVGAGALDGPFSVTAAGTLTVNGIERPVEVAIDAEVVGSTIVVVGSAPVVFADFEVEAPSAPVVVSVEDNGIIEFQLLFVRAR